MIEEGTLLRLHLLAERTRMFANNPERIPVDTRLELQMMVAGTFKKFSDFAELGMKVIGFDISDMQIDIAEYMADMSYGKKKLVMAQRGEAKSTLAALYSVWRLVQDPTYKVMIVSGGEKQANDIALMIIRLIEQWHLLCWLRPDKSKGDRSSFEKYDVHRDLRTVGQKSASVACFGITANLQGNRADLLLADDVETQKNALTQTMRETLLLLTKEFAAINTHGETLYLGTPQTKDSIYRTLPNRGYHVRIWPGRFPTEEEEARYAVGSLAPFVLTRALADPLLRTGGGLTGKLGQPADPVRYNEAALVEKELDLGIEGFALQYMLDTTLADEMRTRIKVQDFICTNIDSPQESVPERFQYRAEKEYLFSPHDDHIILGLPFYKAASSSTERVQYVHKLMVVDPAGAGGDEVAYSIGGASNSFIHGLSVGGLRGGMSEGNIGKLIELCQHWGVKVISVESNMGHGTVEALIRGELDKKKIYDIGVEGFYPKGQKEKRIIDTVGPLTRRHKIVIHQSMFDDDLECCKKHARERQSQMSFFYQIANITYDRESLVFDDRADAFAAMCNQLQEHVALDDMKVAEKREEAKAMEFINNPMGYTQDRKRDRGTSRRIQSGRL